MTTSKTSKERTYCSVCASKCGVIAVLEDDKLVGVRPDPEHPNHGFCVKGSTSPEWVYNDGRLRYPMRRTNPKTADDPGWVRISWEEALAEVVSKLLTFRDESGSESVAFYRPAPGGSSATDWIQYFERLAEGFGTPNIMGSTHICQWARDSGSVYTYGKGLPTPHYESANTILIWGHNPANSAVHNWNRILKAKKRGARLIVVDPRLTATAKRADLWVRVRPGSDAALALGVINLLISERLLDHEFVGRWTNAPFLIDATTGLALRAVDAFGSGGATEYAVKDRSTGRLSSIDVQQEPGTWTPDPELFVDEEVRLASGATTRVRSVLTLLAERAAEFDPATIERLCGVDEAALRALASAIGGTGPLCYYTYNGVEQHVDTAQTNRALCSMYALTGWLEAEGGNVSLGARRAPSGLLPQEQHRKRLGLDARPLGAPNRALQSYNFYTSILEGEPYRIRALVAFGGNLLLQSSETIRGREALQSLDFYMQMDMFETPSSRFADILLPAATPWESPALSTSFIGKEATAYAEYRRPIVEPQYESRPDIEVIFDLAVRLGLGEFFAGGSVDAAFDAQLKPLGLTLAELKTKTAGIGVARSPIFRDYAQLDPTGEVAGFPTRSKKVELYSELFLEHGYDPLPDGQRAPRVSQEFPLYMTSHKLLQFLHGQGRGVPGLRKQVPEPYVEIHPSTAAPLGIATGDLVRVVTDTGSIKLVARLTEDVAPEVLATQTGWWEACEELGLPGYDPFSADGANMNMIMNAGVLDPISGSVPVKSYPCRVELVPAGARRRTTVSLDD